MAGSIFVSYRRGDSKHAAGRLVDRLLQSYDNDQLFFDIDHIEPGLDFEKVLQEQVEKCDVLLAVIGPEWLDSRDANGHRRLDNPLDFVRIEIETALTKGKRVIPVLVDGANMPAERDLPDTLIPLRKRNAVRIVHERFAADTADLVRALEKIVPAQKSWLRGLNRAKLPTLPRSSPKNAQVEAPQTATDESDPPASTPSPNDGLLLDGLLRPAAFAILGVCSGLMSHFASPKFPESLEWAGGPISSLAGIWFGLALAIGMGVFGRWPLNRSLMLLPTTHLAWKLSMLLPNVVNQVPLPISLSEGILTAVWGASGAFLTYLPVIILDRPLWSWRTAIQLSAIGAAVLIALYWAGVVNERDGLVSFPIWQAAIAAAFAQLVLRPRNNS